jgi:hypothetical protein
MGIGPVPATAKALDQAGLTLADIDLIELNEAFAAQALACTREWAFTAADFERINVRGSGISPGPPVGATGGRMLATLARELELRDAGTDWKPCASVAVRGWPPYSNGPPLTRLAQTAGLTDVQNESRHRAAIRGQGDHPECPGTGASDTYPPTHRRPDAEMGLFGLMIRRSTAGWGVAADLRAVCGGTGPRLDEHSGVINTHIHRGLHDRQHGTDEQKQRFLPRMATGEVRGAFLDVRTRTGLRRRGHPHQGGPRRRRLRDQRPEDVADQRRKFEPWWPPW